MNSLRSMRPFDFMVPFWGKRYREYFVDLCLPSLLAPNNLPLLGAEDEHRFLIATTSEDWHAIEQLPIMERLRRHAIPTWLEVSSPAHHAAAIADHADYTIAIRHQNHCRKVLLETAYARRGYGILLCPDLIFSDYMVAALIKRAQAGYQLVLTASIRQVEEDVLDDLRRKGYLRSAERLSMTGAALTLSQREVADLFIRHLHPESLPYDQGRLVQPFVLPFMYWRIGGGCGVIMHTFSALPVLMDFEAMPANHAECLNEGDIENDYISKSFSGCSRIHIVEDSDEFALVSLTPSRLNWAPPAHRGTNLPWLEELRRLANIRRSMWFFAGAHRAALRRDLFRVPMRWHAGELDDPWKMEEQRIERQIDRAVGDFYRVGRPPGSDRFPSQPTLLDCFARAETFIRKTASLAHRILGQSLELSRRIRLILSGNPDARRWFVWRMHVLWRRLTGHTTHPPRPDVP